MLVALSDHEADFIVIGAYAMAAHGLVRATADIDIWVAPTPENATRVWAALEDFRAPLQHITLEDLSKPGIVFQIGVKPVRIDILTQISGIDDFTQAQRKAHLVNIDGLNIPVLSREDLITNKTASARPKDLNDVQWLRSHSYDDE